MNAVHNHASPIDNSHTLEILATRFINSRSLPLTTFQQPAMMKLLRCVNPTWKPPSPERLASVLESQVHKGSKEADVDPAVVDEVEEEIVVGLMDR